MTLTKVSNSMISSAPLSVLDYGADPSGIADSTIAIQAAITAGIAINAEIVFPPGIYIVTSTLTIASTGYGQGVHLRGLCAGSNLPGNVSLIWKGTVASSSVIHLLGSSWTKISRLKIYSYDIDLYPFLKTILVESAQSIGGSGSSGTIIEECIISGGVGIGSSCLQFGTGLGDQVSEIKCTKVLAQSAYSNALAQRVTENGFYIDGGGNTKDMTFIDCSQIFFTVAGVHYTSSVSGWNTWINLGGGESAIDFFMENAGGNITVIGGGSEVSKQMLVFQGHGASPCNASFSGYKAEKLAPTGAYFIELGALGTCSLQLQNCAFSFSTPGNYYILHKDAAFTANPGQVNSLVSINNWYETATTIIPVWSYGFVGTTQGVASIIGIYSFGDYAGPANTVQYRLLPIQGGSPQRFNSLTTVASNWWSTRSLPSITYQPAIAPGIYKITVDHTYLVDANTAVSIIMLRLGSMSKIAGAYAVVNTAFALGASTIDMSVGINTGTEILLARTVSGFTGQIGTSNAELGSYLARATAVQGGFVDMVTAYDGIKVVFSSTVGNFGNGTITSTTTGNVDIYLVIQDLAL